jgi:hypothetical protein
MPLRISVIPDPDRTRWIVRLNSRDVIVFEGPSARSCAEREADALERRLTEQARVKREGNV